MRHHDSSIRLRAYGFTLLALVATAAIVRAYRMGDAALAWWVIGAGAVGAAAHFYRRSRG